MAKYKKRKDGRYATTITLGKDIYGNPIRKTVYGKTIKEVDDKKIKLLCNGSAEKHNFRELAEEMLEERESIISIKTYKGYEQAFAKLYQIYDYDIEDITPNLIDNILHNLGAQGYSYSLVAKVKIVYSLTVKHALRKGINVIDYTSIISVPKTAKKGERTPISDKDIKTIQNSANHEFGLYPLIMLYTGLRRGELLALQWQDIDMITGQIRVTKAVTFDAGNQPKIKTPKTKSGIRNVPILNILKQYFAQGKLKNRSEDYVFGGKKPYTQIMIDRRWDNYVEKHGMKITQHQLRHTYATILYRAGIDAKTAQTIMGHANVRTTLDIYTHAEKYASQSDVEKLNNLVSSQKMVRNQ